MYNAGIMKIINQIKANWAMGGARRWIIGILGVVVSCCLLSMCAGALGGGNRAVATPTVAAVAARATDAPKPVATVAPTERPTARPTNTPVPTPAPTRTPATINERIEAIGQAGCGKGFVSSDYTLVSKQARVLCEVPENFTNSLTTAGTIDDLVKVSQNIFSAGDIDVLLMQFRIDLKDQYGNTSKGNVFVFRVTKALASKVNWAGVNRKDFGKLIANGVDGSSVVVHPAVREWWDGYLK